MSRILNHKKKILSLLIIFMAVMLLFIKQYLLSCICFAILVVLITAIMINKKIIALMKKQASVFDPYSNIRNVDCLVIGDMYKLPAELKEKNTIQLAAPERTLFGSFEILRHTHSILKEDESAEVVIAVKRKNLKKREYSVFDVFFFHYITLKTKNLYELKNKSNNLMKYAPLETLKMFLACYSSGYCLDYSLDTDIAEFCQERGYKVTFLCK